MTMAKEPERTSNALTARQSPQYNAALEDPAARMFLLFRLSTLLHGLDELEAVSWALLASLVSSELSGSDRAALFLVDQDGARCLGFDGAAERDPDLDLASLLDRFPASLADFRKRSRDPRVRLGSGFSREVRRLASSLHAPELAMLRESWNGAASWTVPVAMEEAPLPWRAVLGPGPWLFWPLRGAQEVVALLALRDVEVPGDDREARHELLSGFCHHAGLAVERGRTRLELERRLAELSSVQEIARGLLSATNLPDLLHLFARTTCRALGAQWSVAWLSKSEEEDLSIAATSGLGPDHAALLDSLKPRAVETARSQRPARVRDGADDTSREAAGIGSGAALLVPLVAFDRTLGVLGIGGRAPQGAEGSAFTRDDEEFLSVLAAQAAIAIRNAQLFEAVRDADRRLRETQHLLLQTEKLAALGEMSAKVAHEIRNPLAAVGGFARRIQKNLPADDPNAAHAGLIVREIERLEGIVTEQLQFARMSRPRLQMLDLGEIIRETLLLVREEAERKKVRLVEEYAPGLPKLLLDADKMKQVLLNILRNALEAVSEGHRIQIRTGRSHDDVRVEIANDGDPLPGEVLDSLFVPFATTRAGGSGLGLAVARQIVQDHGGEIQVRTGSPWSVVFTLSFPVRENQDRRKVQRDRRTSRDRRRAA